MKSRTEKAFIGLSAGMVAFGLVTAFQPPSSDPDEHRRRQMIEDVQAGGDALELQREAQRDAARRQSEADAAARQRPGIHRTPEPQPKPRVRVRIR